MKTLTFDEKYGDIREDGLTVIQEQKGGIEWARLAIEICEAVNACRFASENPIAQAAARVGAK